MAESKRQLAAIMFTDIVGYTELMGRDEDQAFQLLRKNRKIQKSLIEKYRGEWLKEMGDGILACFSSTSDAVKCAGEIQIFCKKKDIKLRIGIHEGEVVYEGGDVFGDGVNIASRLEELAEEGAIYISGSVYKDIKNKAGIVTDFVEKKMLKGVDGPVKVYSVQCNEVGKVLEQPIEEPKKSKKKLAYYLITSLIIVIAVILIWRFLFQKSTVELEKSIAVLPFKDMSPEGDQEYFADGISDEIINILINVPGLKVAGRTSSFSFRGRKETLKSIGKQLGVSTILDGSVRKSVNRVRINVQLVQVSDGFNLWSKSYDGELEDVFTLQDSVARAIADELQLTLNIHSLSRHERGHTDNMVAYELYLQGRHQFAGRSDPTSFRRIREYYEQAVKVDPEFALAYAGLAQAYVLTPFYDREADISLWYTRAKEAVTRALELNPNIPNVLASVGYVALFVDWDFISASKYLNRAVELGPSYVWGYHFRGVLQMSQGHYEAALRDQRIALELDPLSPIVNYNVGLYLRGMSKLEAAQVYFEYAAHSVNPAPHWVRDNAIVLGILGRETDSRQEWVEWARVLGYSDLDRVRKLWDEYPSWSSTGTIMLDPFNESKKLKVWGAKWMAFLHHLEKTTNVGDVAYPYILVSPDAFLNTAETMVQERSIWALLLNRPEFYRNFKDVRRYQALLKRVGLPPPEKY